MKFIASWTETHKWVVLLCGIYLIPPLLLCLCVEGMPGELSRREILWGGMGLIVYNALSAWWVFRRFVHPIQHLVRRLATQMEKQKSLLLHTQHQLGHAIDDLKRYSRRQQSLN